MNIPTNLKYSTSDEWVKVEGDIAVLGVSDFAQEQLSDIVFFEAIVAVGDHVNKNATIATLESVKAAADVNSPVSGKVVEINENLSQNPELVNTHPYDQAWMVKLKLDNPAELDNLMDAAAYQKHAEEHKH
jgi:glycine cleavage system H protein